MANSYGVIDRRLSEVPYLAGEYSIADMATYPWLRPHKWQGQDLAEFPHLSRWYTDVRARPAVQRGLAILRDTLDQNRDKPSGEAWNTLFGAKQFERR
jgi:GSH-dependent disulfide-bond oxidoreductase